MNRVVCLVAATLFLAGTAASSYAQNKPSSPAEAIRSKFAAINRQVLEMAKDFPEEKYGYKPTPEVRSFGEVIVHILSGNVYAAKAGRGEKTNWDELDAKNYKTKAATVEALEKSINDATATLKAVPNARFAQTLAPWLSVLEHSAEHYGQLVVYYRLNGLVPPASRPATSK
jgi:uncharacterized damage-inducible protein DinB